MAYIKKFTCLINVCNVWYMLKEQWRDCYSDNDSKMTGINL